MNPHQWPVWHDQRNHRSGRDYRSFGPYPGQGAGGFPTESSWLAPQQFGQQLPAAPAASSAGGGGGLLGSFNLKDIKAVVDRLGGIEGIISTVGKVQKIVSNIQQMQPMIKLLMNMLPGKSSDADADDSDWKRPRRRKRRRIGRKGRKGRKKAYTRSTIYVYNARRQSPYR
ncbi:aminotransferase [Paenibacillus mesophilus]|uniref:aminotransferase n=1 Tax=Paenibacillus mesophilus TaxID=2582849 RepID=UPI00110D987A|nr:aminotransferase [Paenibacillus mesophilus]TMV49685.1 aminotransferase [Paenibacillus mesophilus]